MGTLLTNSILALTDGVEKDKLSVIFLKRTTEVGSVRQGDPIAYVVSML